MPAALPLSSKISQASQNQTEFRVIETRYGNGYSQRAVDGFNATVASWNVDWGVIDSTDFSTITAALDASAGVDYFTWTAPGDATSKKWIVKKYDRQISSGSLYRVSATLQQVFDL